MKRENGTYKKIGDYHFYIKKSAWVLRLPDERRIMCNADPYTDEIFSQWLDAINDGKLSKVLRPLMKKHYMTGNVPVLMDCTDSGFKFVKGEVQSEIDLISSQIQKLIRIYCDKNKNKNYDEISEIQDVLRRNIL